MYLDNMIYIELSDFKNDNLNKLTQLKKELDNEGLIVREEDVTISYDIEKSNLWTTFLENFLTIIRGKKINKI